jgi:hypothetical protein
VAACSPLPSDSKAFRSESESFATRATGSCGMDPIPVCWRMATLRFSSMGDWLDGVRKSLVRVWSSKFSAFARRRFTDFTTRGGGTDVALTRPRKGSPGVTAVFEGMIPSSA